MSNTDTQKVKAEVSTTPGQTEKSKLVELKNGKAILRQKTLSMEKMSETMQEIVKLRGFIDDRLKENLPPLQDIPDDHLPVIAKLVHESDKTLGSLARHIQAALEPEDLVTGNGDSTEQKKPQLTLVAIENAILTIAERRNYGVDWLGRTSASLSIWRWELKEQRMDWLPKSLRGKLESRIAERRQAKNELRSLYESLPQSERESMLKGSRKSKADEPIVIVIDPGASHNDENKAVTDPVDERMELDEENSDTKKAPVRPKKEKDPEQVAKEKEKAERKAAKAEKERKEKEAQNKSRSIMSAFFNKPKVSNSSPQTAETSISISPRKLDPSSSKSDYDKTFKPFVIKKDAVVAPVNWFEWRKQSNEVIVIDQEDDLPCKPLKMIRLNDQTSPLETLASHCNAVPHDLRLPTRTDRRSGQSFKTFSQYCVKDVMSQLSEAEVLGDATTVRRIHRLLCDRTRIPAKVLIFHEDTRPGYFGTFTKSSTSVGPRTPFAKDAVVFDYSYDSGEEWEEEEEGGEDVVSQDGSEDEAAEIESELDDWLVDEEEEVDPGTPLSDRGASPNFSLPPLPSPEKSKKRRTAGVEKKEPKKRKVVPLVPFIKGPCLEDQIGHCDYEPFRQYRIQLFNDTPFPIDPFTFVSQPIAPDHSASMKPAFAVPAPPTHITQSNSIGSLTSTISSPLQTSTSGTSLSGSTTLLPTKRKAVAVIKTPFPDALMPFLADKVTSLATGNLTWLIESLYQDLKAHKVKKVSIEAKVREVVEKCPSKKIWVVKDDVLVGIPTTIGLTRCQADALKIIKTTIGRPTSSTAIAT